MGVVGTQQLTVNGDKALQTAVNTLTWCASGSVRHPSRVFVRVGKRETDRQIDAHYRAHVNVTTSVGFG